MELISVTFGGGNNHKVINYNLNYVGNGSRPYSSPEWTKDGTTNPICYVKDSPLKLTASVVVMPADTPKIAASFEIEQGQSVDTFNKTMVSGGDNSLTFTTTNIKTVNHVQKAEAWNMEFSCALNDSDYRPIGSSSNQIYTIFGAPVGALTEKRLIWCTNIADGAATITSAAEKFRDVVSVNPGHQRPIHWNLNSWEFLDSGLTGDCITLAKLCAVGLRQIGIDAQERWAWETLDGTPGFPPVSATTSTNMTTEEFEFNGEFFKARLIYPGNNFMAFFTVNDSGIKAYTVFPSGGPFENQTYYYLEVLRSVAVEQFWVWDEDQTHNGVSVSEWDRVPGQEDIPVPAIPER